MRPVVRSGLWFVTFGLSLSLGCKRVQPVPEPVEQLTRAGAVVATEPVTRSPGHSFLASSEVGFDTAPSSSTPTPVPSNAPSVVGLRPELRRLVVSNGIKDKEPLPFTLLKANEPVVAFLELANHNAEASLVRVIFQHESGLEVGFVELAVPADTTRWRTWAQTGMVKHAGKWTAIVRGVDGSELGQKGFFVSPT
jgi:hypothetical protein